MKEGLLEADSELLRGCDYNSKIDAVVDTRGQAHVQEIIAALVARQFNVSIIDEQSS